MRKENKIGHLTAIILCGGKGERLRPLTENIPKPLIPIRGLPIIDFIIRYLLDQGIERFVFATGYKSELIEEFLHEKYKHLNYKISNSGDVDIAQRIQDSLKHIPDDCLIFYGDTLTNVNLYQLVKKNVEQENLMTVAVLPIQLQFGLFEIAKNGNILSYEEKPILDKWINIGHFYYSRKLDKILFNCHTFEDFLKEIVSQSMLGAYQHLGLHITVNTQQELAAAEKNISNFFPLEGKSEKFLDQ